MEPINPPIPTCDGGCTMWHCARPVGHRGPCQPERRSGDDLDSWTPRELEIANGYAEAAILRSRSGRVNMGRIELVAFGLCLLEAVRGETRSQSGSDACDLCGRIRDEHDERRDGHAFHWCGETKEGR